MLPSYAQIAINYVEGSAIMKLIALEFLARKI
jgi:hypothetical protein